MQSDSVVKEQTAFSLRYENMINSLRAAILSGVMQPGDLLESEHELTQHFQVSRSSVRKALAELAAAGLVVKAQGKGTFVAHRPNNQTGGVINIAVFTPNYDMGTIVKLVNLYEQKHPKVKVRLLEFLAPGYFNTIRNYSSAVDLIFLSDTMFNDINPQEELQNLSSIIPDTSQFYQAALKPFCRANGPYAVPIMLSPVFLCYNKGHFDQAGLAYPDENWTWADLLANAQLLTKFDQESNVTSRFGLQFSQSVTRFSLFLLQHEALLQDETGRPTLDSERVREVVEFCTRLMYRYRVSPVSVGDSYQTAHTLFSSGQIAMAFMTMIQMNSFSDIDFAWGIAPPPKDRCRGSILVSFGLAMSRRAPNPDLAGHFIDFMVSPETQSYLKQESMSLPVLPELVTDIADGHPRMPAGAYGICNQISSYAATLDMIGIKWLTILRNELILTWGNMETPAQGCARAQARAMQVFINDMKTTR